jgi:hypothetical protein
MGLTYVLPILEITQSLNKLVQNINYFIYDFVTIMKLTKDNFYKLYMDFE